MHVDYPLMHFVSLERVILRFAASQHDFNPHGIKYSWNSMVESWICLSQVSSHITVLVFSNLLVLYNDSECV